MPLFNPQVDEYLAIGCGRCSLFNTPQCKVHTWTEELEELRGIVLQSELIEERKWGVPCYTYNKANILIISAFKEYCSISFFKGSLLDDPAGILEKAGENSNVARLIKFRSMAEVERVRVVLPAYIQQAIELEKAGVKIKSTAVTAADYPAELHEIFEENPLFKAAFSALSQGRQRGYLLHFNQAKQSGTRRARILKYLPLIMEGKGLHDDYRAGK